ncbi:MAG: AmmeMemoRadiSam system protein B, partial [Nitrosopumilus sp.]|nr:AmmeMemoRadiSam system protein B [Nitrosopumilus sp.]
MIREPVVAGQFYPERKEDLKNMIKNCMVHRYGPGSKSTSSDERVYGIICPHA